MLSMNLEVELPMILGIGNKGTVDIANGWSNNGCMWKHIDVHLYFWLELKEARIIIKTRWISSKCMSSDFLQRTWIIQPLKCIKHERHSAEWMST